MLDFIDAPDIAESDAQSFWIRVNCPVGQAPGLYEGQVTVAPSNAEAWSLPLKVRVRDFEMSVASPLPTALPPEASEVLAALHCDLIDEEDLRPEWLTTLADAPNHGSIREEVRSLARGVVVPSPGSRTEVRIR